MQGTLTQHLIETNEAALDLMESLVNQMAAAKGVTVRNQIRHETDPTALAENRKQRAAITSEITALRNRVKRVKHIQKDAPRLLNLLRTEMQREYERKHPIKEQQRQRTHRDEPER